MDNNLLAKREIINTVSTRGWHYVTEIAEQLVRRIEREAIDEEDDVKGNNLRREAKAARRFVTDFFRSIEHARQLTEPDAQQFLEISSE